MGQPMSLVGESGAPAGEKVVVFYNPPVVNAELGIRRPYLKEAARLAGQLVTAGASTLVFVETRRGVELVLRYLRERLRRAGKDPESVRGYRGGYLALLKSGLAGADSLRSAARQRLVLLGMSEELIGAVERDRRVQPRVTLQAPIGGVIAALEVREGMTVMPGATLFRIVDLSTVWVNAEVPESQSAAVRPGTPVVSRGIGLPTSFESEATRATSSTRSASPCTSGRQLGGAAMSPSKVKPSACMRSRFQPDCKKSPRRNRRRVLAPGRALIAPARGPRPSRPARGR